MDPQYGCQLGWDESLNSNPSPPEIVLDCFGVVISTEESSVYNDEVSAPVQLCANPALPMEQQQQDDDDENLDPSLIDAVSEITSSSEKPPCGNLILINCILLIICIVLHCTYYSI